MKLLAVILYAALRLLEYGATDPAHHYDPAGAVVTETVVLTNTVWSPLMVPIMKPIYLGNRKWRFEKDGEYKDWPGRWWCTKTVVIEWWTNRTASVSGNRIETRWSE